MPYSIDPPLPFVRRPRVMKAASRLCIVVVALLAGCGAPASRQDDGKGLAASASAPSEAVPGSPPAARSMLAGNAWGLATARNPTTGHVMIFRFISAFPADFSRSAFPERVTLRWPYHAAQRGMPVTADREHMDALEDQLAKLLERDGAAVLVLVVTGENQRDLVYYARSANEVAKRLDATFAAASGRPFSMDTAEEADWHTYADFVRGLEK